MEDGPETLPDEAPSPGEPSTTAVSIVVLAGPAFTLLHLVWYTRVVAYRLWELSGGIVTHGALTHFGATDWAWTVPLHLPAGLMFGCGLGGLGFLLIPAGSLVAGYSAALLLARLFGGGGPGMGPRWWRLWLFLAGWSWVPVPSTWSWVYQWTVVY